MLASIGWAVAYRNTGRGREARELLEETIFRARATRDRVTEAAAEFELGALVDDVEPSQALAHYAHSHALAVATNDRLGQVRALTQRAVTLARIGRVEEAHVALHAGQALDPSSPLVTGVWRPERSGPSLRE